MLNPDIHLPEEELQQICRRNNVRELAVFGSATTDRFTVRSDLDLLVDFLPRQQIGLLDLARMNRELTDIVGRPVDLVPKAGLKPIIRESVLSSSEIIYAA